MQKSIAVISVMLLLISTSLIGQNKSTKEVAKTDFNSRSILPEKSFDFITQYGINVDELEIYTTLEDVHIRNKPDFNGGTYDIMIPEGTHVEVFKYLSKQAFYIVRYEEVWGFIPSTTIIKNNSQKHRLHVSEVDRQPQLISNLEVTYPNDASLKSIEGTVVLKIDISKTGAVTNAVVEQSVPGLDEHAIEIVKDLKFKPALKNGKPVEVFQNFPVDFKHRQTD
ncbi:MAG: energy transducer TonB [Bacteroidetes bacterium]|nr:energy transducer TonB [Bacteroidota bacterium]